MARSSLGARSRLAAQHIVVDGGGAAGGGGSAARGPTAAAGRRHILLQHIRDGPQPAVHSVPTSGQAVLRRQVRQGEKYRHVPEDQRCAARPSRHDSAACLVRDGEIGTLKTIQSLFSYYNVDPGNIRNMADIGGGGLMDIGCYPISLSRFIFDAEPARVVGAAEFDPEFKTDRIASAIMDFAGGTASFTCSTQLAPYQRVHIVGDQGRIEIEIPFNAPNDQRCRLWHQVENGEIHEIEFDVCDQYGIQGDLFSQAIRQDTPVPTPIADAVGNMKVIEAIFRSAESGQWETP